MPDGLDALVAVCAYEGVGRGLVLALKRRNRRSAVGVLAGALADELEELGVSPGADRALTWAPTTGRRRRRRGFDQAEVLARAASRNCEWPARALLTRSGTAQVGRGRDERLGGVELSPTGVAPPTVAVLDDVVTSGATMTAAAGALRAVGATTVIGLAVAVTAGA